MPTASAIVRGRLRGLGASRPQSTTRAPSPRALLGDGAADAARADPVMTTTLPARLIDGLLGEEACDMRDRLARGWRRRRAAPARSRASNGGPSGKPSAIDRAVRS